MDWGLQFAVSGIRTLSSELRSGEMASRLHQIARAGVVEDGEDFFRESTDSRGLKAANALDGMQR